VRWAVLCIERALRRAGLETSIVKDKLPVLMHTLDVLWRVSSSDILQPEDEKSLKESTNELEKIASDEESPEGRIIGLSDLLCGMECALAAALGHGPHRNAAQAAGYAYQVVWSKQLQPQTTRPLLPWDMDAFCRQLELKDQVCMDDLAFQFECLARLEAGQDVQRSTAPLES
jgi:hypothetical protein